MFYPTFSAGLSYGSSFNNHWQLNTGAGIWSYVLVNQGPKEHYILDFASPYAMAGVRYYRQETRTRGYYFKLSSGAQLGYRGSHSETFDDYSVITKSDAFAYGFVRPEVGIKVISKKKTAGH